MRTTLDIDADVLQAAKELARHDGTTAGKVLSGLARKGLNGDKARAGKKYIYKNGIPVLPHREGDIITIEHIRKIMDEEGI